MEIQISENTGKEKAGNTYTGKDVQCCQSLRKYN